MSSLNFLPLEVNFKPSEKHWIASCPCLGVVTQGENYEAAQKNLEEAIILFIESCLKRGTLKQVLAESGYQKVEIERFVSKACDYFIPAESPSAISPQCHA